MSPSASLKPGKQPVTTQPPVWHWVTAPGLLHWVPHAPQLSSSLWRSMPSSICPSQSSSALLQLSGWIALGSQVGWASMPLPLPSVPPSPFGSMPASSIAQCRQYSFTLQPAAPSATAKMPGTAIATRRLRRRISSPPIATASRAPTDASPPVPLASQPPPPPVVTNSPLVMSPHWPA